MDVLSALIAWTILGLIAGGIARLLVPGPQRIGCLGTILLGVCGSLLGGFVSWLLVGGRPLQPSGWILSTLGAVVLLVLFVRRRTLI